MAKNIYRVDAKTKLDEIVENNFWKPICMIFIKKSAMKTGEYDILQTEMMKVAKACCYAMILIIDFDNYTDYNDTFAGIREAVPFYAGHFRTKPVSRADGNDKPFATFLMEVMEKIDDFHSHYIGELMKHFMKENTKSEQTEQQAQQPQKVQERERTHSTEQVATTTTPAPTASTRAHVPPPPPIDEDTTPSIANKNDNIADLLRELEGI